VTGQRKPDLLFVTLIHQALRADAERLVAATAAVRSDGAGRLTGVRAFFDEYRAQLCLHHSHEDDIFFPALRAALEVDRLPFAELARQHEALDGELEAIRGGLASMASAPGDVAPDHTDVVDTVSDMATHLGAHLTKEEETILPLVESTFLPATYKQLEAQARRRTPRRRARFLVPWLVAHATSEQQKALFKSAPPLRAVNVVNRRGYRALDRALVC
jgi:iron-sulfur cluster repair protein YtfE (RIC family)